MFSETLRVYPGPFVLISELTVSKARLFNSFDMRNNVSFQNHVSCELLFNVTHLLRL